MVWVLEQSLGRSVFAASWDTATMDEDPAILVAGRSQTVFRWAPNSDSSVVTEADTGVAGPMPLASMTESTAKVQSSKSMPAAPAVPFG